MKNSTGHGPQLLRGYFKTDNITIIHQVRSRLYQLDKEYRYKPTIIMHNGVQAILRSHLNYDDTPMIWRCFFKFFSLNYQKCRRIKSIWCKVSRSKVLADVKFSWFCILKHKGLLQYWKKPSGIFLMQLLSKMLLRKCFCKDKYEIQLFTLKHKTSKILINSARELS